MSKTSLFGVNNLKFTNKGEVVMVKSPREINTASYNVCLTYEEYSFLLKHSIDKFEIQFGKTVLKIKWEHELIQFAELRKAYYLVPYSKQSLLYKKVGS